MRNARPIKDRCWMTCGRRRMCGRMCSASLLLILGACSHLTSSPGGTRLEPATAREFCLIAKPVLWSVRDTPATVAQIKEHNMLGKALCGWGASPPIPVAK